MTEMQITRYLLFQNETTLYSKIVSLKRDTYRKHLNMLNKFRIEK